MGRRYPASPKQYLSSERCQHRFQVVFPHFEADTALRAHHLPVAWAATSRRVWGSPSEKVSAKVSESDSRWVWASGSA